MFGENFMLISRKVMVWLSILCSNVVLVKTLGSHLKREIYTKFYQHALRTSRVTIGSPKRRVECTNNASKYQFALSSPHSFVICRAPQALN